MNRPAQKLSDQFTQAEVASKFGIASTRIHVEHFIGRVREWSILNAVWPVQRMDLLSSTWQALCHIVHLTMPPIGPNEGRWFINPSCVFIKLITADYKLKYNMKVSVILTKPAN